MDGEEENWKVDVLASVERVLVFHFHESLYVRVHVKLIFWSPVYFAYFTMISHDV